MLKKSGELGLMGVSIPEEFGGFGQSFVTQMLVAETTGAGYSFSVAYMAHCGIGTLPIMYYGNKDQRERYVTKLASGEFIGLTVLPNREPEVMQTQEKQMQNYPKTENIIFSTVRRCGSQMPDLHPCLSTRGGT